MNELKSGIYKITINDYYIYIGQSADVEKRWNGHLNELKRNKHYNKKLQNTFNKHSDSIKFQIIEECDVDKLDEREIFYIEQFNTFDTNHGLNMSIGGDCGCRKYKTKEEVKAAALEHFKQYRKTHKKELKVKSKQYYLDNKKYFRERSRQRYIDNKEKIKKITKNIVKHIKKKLNNITKNITNYIERNTDNIIERIRIRF